ncbi:outer membrane beta-barrel protein [Spirosoma oryzicola]|uniref:outer membrane beta-barrel protein n=1 Tax=Spirosoma oryzicola TaxID=2898794 RepID=UPI001E2CEE30|nr:outer membrane beta-barrel protein [Spirosoma oryzicola]UHG90517.1 PorT family protein [Spirosoma oryzicola]
MKTLKHFLTTAFVAASVATFAQTTTVTVTTDSTTNRYRAVQRVTSDFSIYVGFNNFGGSLPAGYDFRPIGSRFIALAWQKRIPLITNGSTKLRLVTGPEIAWNNFMFEGRNTLTEQNNQLIVEAANVDLRKSKLVTTQLNLPVLLNLRFRSGFTVGAGAYVGMRLDSYTKVKPEGQSAVRTHGSFNLNPVRWGLTSEIGYRGSAKLFFRYEPNSPFRTGEGPDASVWAVGLKL